MIDPPDGVTVPMDLKAERIVAAVCAMSPAGADRAHERLNAHVWYDPLCRRVFLASRDVTVTEAWYTAPAGEACDRRLDAIARITTISRRELDTMIAAAPVAADTAGKYADRVLDAAGRRYLMGLGADLHDQAATASIEHLGALITEAARVVG